MVQGQSETKGVSVPASERKEKNPRRDVELTGDESISTHIFLFLARGDGAVCNPRARLISLLEIYHVHW